MIAEWEVQFVLETQLGNLPFNQPLDTDDTLRWFQLVPGKCNAVLPVRSTDDDVPQGDGKISHRRWRSGYQAHLAVVPLIWGGDPDNTAEPACGADLVAMLDILGLHLNELIRTGQIGGPGARLVWTPSGAPDRMFDRVQLLATSPLDAAGGDLGGALVEFDIDSAFPYYIRASETDTTIADGATATITNEGNTDYFPVFQIFGGFTGFTLVNHSVQDSDGNDIELVYDSTLPGAAVVAAGDYIEIEFFRETAYLNGHFSNRKAGIDWRQSDFFPLVPGDNNVEVNFTGPSGTPHALCKSNGAWA